MDVNCNFWWVSGIGGWPEFAKLSNKVNGMMVEDNRVEGIRRIGLNKYMANELHGRQYNHRWPFR
jgi:hypothetical protein